MTTTSTSKELVFHQDFPSVGQFRDLVAHFTLETDAQNTEKEQIFWSSEHEIGALFYRLLGNDVVLFYQDVEIKSKQKICIHPNLGDKPFYLIKYIVEQNMDFSLDGHIHLSSGDLFLCNSIWGHDVELPSGYTGKILQIIFSQEFLLEFVPDTYARHAAIYNVFRANAGQVVLLPQVPYSLKEHLLDICTVLQANQPIRASKIRLLQQFAKFVEEYFCHSLEKQVYCEPLNDKWFRTKVLDFFRKNLETDWVGLDVLSSSLCTSPSTLKRRFYSCFGSSPHTYFRYLQMQRARELLEQHGTTVAEVAAKLGFSSVSSFIRCFKKFHDHTPGKFSRRELI